MSNLNQVMLIGNLGKDPEVIKTTELGDFVRISLATTKRYKDKKGEQQIETQWHVVYLSNRLGKIGSSYLKKGDKIFISGELKNREWFDDEGQRHFHTSVYAKELKFLTVKPKREIKSESSEVPYTKAMQEIRNALGDHLLVSN